MKFRKLLTALLLAAGVVFVAGWQQADSPSEVLKKIIAAQKELDYDTVAKLSHGEDKKGYKNLAEQINALKAAAKNGDKDAQERLDGAKAKLRNWNVDVKAEEIDGDLAVVYCVSAGDGPSYEFFEKVDGEWKNISDEDYTKAVLAKYAAPKGLSPSEVVRRMVDAMKTMNPYAAANWSCGKEREDTLKVALEIVKTKAAAYGGDEEAKKTLDELKAGVESWNVKVAGETIDGDYAVVDVVVSGSPDGKNGPDKVYLKKVDGEWKMMDDDEYKRERSAR